MFGHKPDILYNGDSKVKSKYGGIITLGVILAYCAVVAFTVFRYFQQSSPATNFNRIYTENPEGFKVDLENLPFAFGMQDPSYAHYIDSSVYTVVA